MSVVRVIFIIGRHPHLAVACIVVCRLITVLESSIERSRISAENTADQSLGTVGQSRGSVEDTVDQPRGSTDVITVENHIALADEKHVGMQYVDPSLRAPVHIPHIVLPPFDILYSQSSMSVIASPAIRIVTIPEPIGSIASEINEGSD
jgi:hypothetical protein